MAAIETTNKKEYKLELQPEKTRTNIRKKCLLKPESIVKSER